MTALRLHGHGASRGSALGRARVRLPHAQEVTEKRIPANAVEAELQRLHQAIESARAEMRELRQRLQGALPAEVGEFLDLHAMLLDDPELLLALDERIRSHRYSAAYALRLQRDTLAQVFEGMEDDYLRSRLDDLDHVIGRINAFLHKRPAGMKGLAGEILVCENVAPSELAQLQSQGVVGIVTSAGSPLSHSAILARSLHLPLVVGAAPFYARLVETALREVDRGVIEASQAMGATTAQLVFKVLLPEARPGLIAGATVTTIALIGFTAMGGAIGSGGLGDLAFRDGYQRSHTDVALVTVVLLLVLVQLLQMLGDRLVRHYTRR